MKRVILVAHGDGDNGTFSIPKVKTITPANQILTFGKAKEFLSSSNSWTLYSSTNFFEFDRLSDADCTTIFGRVPAGTGIVPTGTYRIDDSAAGNNARVQVFTVRGVDINSGDIETFIRTNAITSLILLACRS